MPNQDERRAKEYVQDKYWPATYEDHINFEARWVEFLKTGPYYGDKYKIAEKFVEWVEEKHG